MDENYGAHAEVRFTDNTYKDWGDFTKEVKSKNKI